MVVRLHLIIKKDTIAGANKGVSWINYDRWGNPIRVQFTDHSITEHVYTADGRKKEPHPNPLPRRGNSIISSHLPLGEIREGYSNIQQNTNYYPYGGMTSISTGQGEQQFKYNGKEYDPMHGLNEYDYGARQYDPAIGKFTTMDPLCEKYYHISPYAYCGGNPVNRVDVDGDSINFGPLLNQDHAKKRKTAQYILQDLTAFTGLNLYFSSNGYLLYNKEQYSECGSKIARNFLISAIDNPMTISIGDYNKKSAYFKAQNGIGINDSQISEFIKETPSGLDDRTLGYGMVFMHELAHSPIGGSKKDPYEPLEYVQGETVMFINTIRKELDENPCFPKKGCFGCRLSHSTYILNDGTHGIPFAVPNKKRSLFIKTSIY